MALKKVAILTAGGLAPCLSSAVGGLIERYSEIAPDVEIIAYRGGYKGLLLGDSITVTPAIRAKAALLHDLGGSPIGNSRVKLTNAEDCVKRGLVKEGEDPQKVAANQLVKDGVQVLHTIGGDDTNTSAADLAAFLAKNNYGLQVIGLPKTVDNDVFPIRQSLGAATAAEQGAKYFANVVGEHSANPRMLIVHEVMGRGCGWLTVATALEYRRRLAARELLGEIGDGAEQYDVHAVYIPEAVIDIEKESVRLRAILDRVDCVNIFISEGAGVKEIVAEMEAAGEEIPRDPYGHPKLDAINPGKWFGDKFSKKIGSEKTLIQKSGYFARAAAANAFDRSLIKSCTDLAVQVALEGGSGVIGHDEDKGGVLRAIEFPRIKGGKPYDITRPEYAALLAAIGQPLTPATTGGAAH